MNTWTRLIPIVFGLCAFFPPAHGDDIFLKIPGVPGESTTSGFLGTDDWSRVESVGFSAYRSAPGPGGVVTISGFTITKIGDSTSPILFSRVVQGTLVDGMRIEYTTLINGSRKTYLLIEMDGVSFESQGSSTSGERPTESFYLKASKMRMTWTKYNPNTGAADGNTQFPTDGSFYVIQP